MSHSPYEDWLLSEDRLPPADRRELEGHLAICPRCQHMAEAWSEARRALGQAPMVAPAAGFVDRWQVTRTNYERTRRRRFLLIGLLTVIGAATVLALTVLGQGVPTGLALPSLGSLLSIVAQWMVNVSALYYIGRSLMVSLWNTLNPAVALAGWSLSLGGSLALCFVWVALVYRLNWAQAQKGARR